MKTSILQGIGKPVREPLNEYLIELKKNKYEIMFTVKKSAYGHCENHLKIAFTRNPYDRLSSTYSDKVYEKKCGPAKSLRPFS